MLAKCHHHNTDVHTQVSQVQDEIHGLVRAHGTAADPAHFKQIVKPMIEYMFKSMPKLMQASTCTHFQLVLQSPAQHIMHRNCIESKAWKLQLGNAISVSLILVDADTSFLLC